VGKAELAVRAGANAQVIAELPVVEVVRDTGDLRGANAETS
jgi:hypothetical protein